MQFSFMIGILTYMSIYDEIQSRAGEGRLILLPQMMPAPRVRSVWLAAEIIEQARNPPDQSARNASAAVQAILESFVAGDVFVVRHPPSNNSRNVDAALALLNPAHKEAWEFRIRRPNPVIRVFGRFAAKDIFIATSWSYRASLDIPNTRNGKKLSEREKNFIVEKKWRDLGLERCKADWVNLFPSYQPLRGRAVHDYVSNARLAP